MLHGTAPCKVVGVAALAVSFGTRVWLADLLRAGWEASVSEHRPVRQYRLRLADDLEDVVREVAGARRVGVLAVRDGEDGSGVFIPCPDAEAARELLKAALAEAEA